MTNTFLSGNVGQNTDQPAGPQFEQIPSADGTLDGLHSVVSALANNMRVITRNFFGNNTSTNTSSSSKIGGGGGGLKINKKPNPRLFLEVQRKTQEVTVKDDISGAQLTYTQITSLVWRDSATGDTIKWHL